MKRYSGFIDLLMVILCGIASCGYSTPDVGDTADLRETIAAIPPDRARRVIDLTRTQTMCEQLLKALDRADAFKWNSNKGGSGALVGKCYPGSLTENWVGWVMDRSEVMVACGQYPGRGSFLDWWYRSLEATAADKLSGLDGKWTCLGAIEDATFPEAVADVESNNAEYTIEDVTTVLAMLVIAGLIPETILAAELPELLVALRACTLAATPYCDPEFNGTPPAPWTDPGTPSPGDQ